ncbi:OLC1v1006529C1 [Oldenlandia corymbosa var. corymbosa]|uniref:Adenine DNA glycosylase n=1 Tax=Oldenlandia corymbosa var. corymbosa TaxID=529605 RepID=A0AAV1DH85_OLDCO|nr:OLC1v1006529C1 [Oldenlandia corymbosa var. corymbosa]
MGRACSNIHIHYSFAGNNSFVIFQSQSHTPRRNHRRRHAPPSALSLPMGDILPNGDETPASHRKKRPRRIVGPTPKKKEVRKSDDIEDINFSKDEILDVRGSLLKWYEDNQRDLPWRRISRECFNEEDREENEKRAYAVWVSEVMLQQTRVQTVIDYFNRWMNKWPTLHHLAQASLEEVNEMWAGLGYYRRGRFLLEGAKMIVEGGDGFPNEVPALRKVKGIGDYTAGAIASIAFKQVVPVVDGNVVRVIARLRAISANPKEATTVKNIWKLAGQLVDLCRPGDFNQALMELGATVCTPTSPSCNDCPIAANCVAHLRSKCDDSVQVTDYPIKVVKAKPRHEFSAVSVVEILESAKMEDPQSNSKFVLVKRADKGLLAGLWEFPSVFVSKDANSTTRREAINHFLKSSFGLDCMKSSNVVFRENVGKYVHVFSHIRLEMHVEWIALHLKGSKNVQNKKKSPVDLTWKYVERQALARMGLTSGVRKVYDMVENYKQSRLSSPPDEEKQTNGSRNSRNKKSQVHQEKLQWRQQAEQDQLPYPASFPLLVWRRNLYPAPELRYRYMVSSKLVLSGSKLRCSAIQESTTAPVAAQEEKKDEKPEEKEESKTSPPPAPAPAKPAAAAKPAAKAPVKPLPEMMEEEVIPSLQATLGAQQDISELELTFQDNKLEGSFLKKGIPYTFWAFFPDGVLTGPKGFSISSYGSGVSTVEPFLIDEKKITTKHVVFWVEKRLAAQGIIPVWKD